jgi:anti-anti-sigma factor
VTVIHVEGEIDMSNRGTLAHELSRAHGDVILDLGDTKYIDARTIGLLEEAAEQSRMEGRQFILTRVPPLFERLFDIIGRSTYIRCVDAMVAAIHLVRQNGF